MFIVFFKWVLIIGVQIFLLFEPTYLVNGTVTYFFQLGALCNSTET